MEGFCISWNPYLMGNKACSSYLYLHLVSLSDSWFVTYDSVLTCVKLAAPCGHTSMVELSHPRRASPNSAASFYFSKSEAVVLCLLMYSFIFLLRCILCCLYSRPGPRDGWVRLQPPDRAMVSFWWYWCKFHCLRQKEQ